MSRPPAPPLLLLVLLLGAPVAAAPDPLSLAKKAARAASPEGVSEMVERQKAGQQRPDPPRAEAPDAGPRQELHSDDGRAQPSAPQREDEVDEGSPRAALLRFFENARAGRFAEAARILELPATSPGEAAPAARRLKAVADQQRAVFNPARLSPRLEGDGEDGLPAGIDELGRVPSEGGGNEALRLVHRSDRQGQRWVFTRRSVETIDALYARLPNKRLLDLVPDPLAADGPFEIARWQWLLLPAFLLLVVLLAQLLGRLTLKLLLSIARRTVTPWDDALVLSNGGPVRLVWAVVVASTLLPLLALNPPAQQLLDRLLTAALLVAFFWAALRSIDVARTLLGQGRYKDEPSATAFLGFGARFTKLLLGLLAVIGVLAELGYPVGSLLAGLGLGGLAFALAAQKTVENLFGALSIGLDQPFRVGDWVKIEGTEGTVESIGLRSTRIRTMDRTLVTFPNGRLAELRAESYAARDRLRFHAQVGLVYGTSEAQLRRVIGGLRELLRQHPAVIPDDVRVHLKGFGESSLDLEVNVWLKTLPWVDYLGARQELLIGFLRVVEEAGTELAVPTQTLHLRSKDQPQ